MSPIQRIILAAIVFLPLSISDTFASTSDTFAAKVCSINLPDRWSVKSQAKEKSTRILAEDRKGESTFQIDSLYLSSRSTEMALFEKRVKGFRAYRIKKYVGSSAYTVTSSTTVMVSKTGSGETVNIELLNMIINGNKRGTAFFNFITGKWWHFGFVYNSKPKFTKQDEAIPVILKGIVCPS